MAATRTSGVYALMLGLMLGAGLSACRGGSEGVGGGAPTTNLVEAHRAALAVLPATAGVVVTLAPDHLSDELLAQADALLGAAGADRGPVRKDLSALLSKRLGFDLTRFETLTVFTLGDGPAIGLLFPRGAEVPSVRELSLPGWDRGQRDGRIILVPGSMRKAMKSAEGTAAKAGHEALLAGVRGKPVVLLTAAGPGMKALGKGSMAPYAIRGAVLSVTRDGGQRLAVRATPDGRKKILEAFDAGVAMARVALTQMRARVDDLDVATAAGVIYADHRFDAIRAWFQPREDGDFLALDFPAGQGLGAGMLLAGIPASVAIPAFIKYTRRAKTVEAIDMLHQMYRGAAVYYATPHVDGMGNVLPCQFPASVGATPKAGTCCAALGGPDRDGDDRCDADASLWNDPTWKALGFQVSEPHYFVYKFESSGTGASAAFTASAYADLDCDGVMSTFQRMGFGDPSAEPGECSLKDAKPPYMENETE